LLRNVTPSFDCKYEQNSHAAEKENSCQGNRFLWSISPTFYVHFFEKISFRQKIQTNTNCQIIKVEENIKLLCRGFQGFGQAKFTYGGLVLGLILFSLLSQIPQKMTLNSKWSKLTQK